METVTALSAVAPVDVNAAHKDGWTALMLAARGQARYASERRRPQHVLSLAGAGGLGGTFATPPAAAIAAAAARGLLSRRLGQKGARQGNRVVCVLLATHGSVSERGSANTAGAAAGLDCGSDIPTTTASAVASSGSSPRRCTQ